MSLELLFNALAACRNELLLFCSICFLLSALDDLALDLLWLIHRASRWAKQYRFVPPQTVQNLAQPKNPGTLVVFIPTWQESAVIGKMLTRCREAWNDQETKFLVYIGCYPNDLAGHKAIVAAIKNHPAFRIVICNSNGPTTKAHCLNRLWNALLQDELAQGFKAKAIILHDAEDHVDRHELRIFDLLTEKVQAVQLPVIPVAVKNSPWVSGHYLDEFAEAHSKNLVVREAIGAAIPLAGVGCALERNMLGQIAINNGNMPFDPSSLTEDYELGLRIGGRGGSTIIARIKDEAGHMVGTRACFPATLSAAVRQKTRWIMGISLAGWDRLGWKGNAADKWMQMRDRKTVLSAIVIALAYVAIGLVVLLEIAQRLDWAKNLPFSSNAIQLMPYCAVALIWRIAMRCYFVEITYGWSQVPFAIPRMVAGNAIAIMAASRACLQYLRACRGTPLAWDKTEHSHFPEKV